VLVGSPVLASRKPLGPGERDSRSIHAQIVRVRHNLVVRLACGNEGLGETSVVEKRHSPRVEKLRRQVEGLGVTLSWEGNQWVLCGRETERLGYSIKTEADALQFALDRARVRRVSRDGR
jgi:hypothetical protein